MVVDPGLVVAVLRARTIGRVSENNYLTAVKALPHVDGGALNQYRWVNQSTQPAWNVSSRRRAAVGHSPPLPHDVVDALVTATAT